MPKSDDDDTNNNLATDDVARTTTSALALSGADRGAPSDARALADAKYALERAHPLPQFDGRVRLDEAEHRYYIDGVDDAHALSMTAWVTRYAEHFDAPRVIDGMLRSGSAARADWYAAALAAVAAALGAQHDAHVDAFVARRTSFADLERAAAPDTVRSVRDVVVAHASHVWASAGAEASAAGTAMHERIELFYRGVLERAELERLAATRREYAHFLAFHDAEIADRFDPVRLELLVFDTDNRLRVRGALDAVFRSRATGRLRIVDWKRWKPDKYGGDPARLQRTGFRGRRQRPPFAHLHDSAFTKYSLQQTGYRYLVERYSEWRIDDGAYLAVFHPDRPSYVYEQADDLRAEFEHLVAEREREVAQLSPTVRERDAVHVSPPTKRHRASPERSE